MPNWDNDEGPGFNDFDDVTEEKISPSLRRREYQSSYTRKGVLNVPERQVRKTWNGNPVSGMDSDHVMNAILYCEKKYIEAWSNHKGCHGDKEEFYFKSVYEMFPEYINVRNEWTRRMGND